MVRLGKLRHYVATAEQDSPRSMEARVQVIDFATQRLAFRLGVPLRDLSVRPCAGYANGCVCPECKTRLAAIAAHRSAGREPFDHEGKLRPAPSKRQPWQHTRAA